MCFNRGYTLRNFDSTFTREIFDRTIFYAPLPRDRVESKIVRRVIVQARRSSGVTRARNSVRAVSLSPIKVQVSLCY